ncbi:potassium-transporting ATPase, C subunit [Pirellula staleyi DSM 6068]|uniref:Potassium-transporting ATPase KdpC subunit n=1 Tax=Pirellula staleyi (strain ATCC 27377 / DSM 6068 / ICPB 4128) TaxID=530564 RepID=D2R315_PIRSD|nr:potassium-transporting ATPase subunit KdpC [Pirellula staleyi]ADB18748.1 potassium-transporting ATPase, C subunit [Pirellula staleyi DSM 6068]
MFQQLLIAARLLLMVSLVTGVAYPLAVTAIAQVLFPRQANGSLLYVDDQAVGSELIGQNFSRDDYFWGRPSATSGTPYNGGASSGSNYGPLHPSLAESVEARMKKLALSEEVSRQVPVDLVTSSGSGLDPHISPAAARFQIARVAKARKMDPQQLEQLIDNNLEDRSLGILGEPRVNVLKLNLLLDQQ